MIDFETLKAACEDAGLDYRSYSGRGMYGDRCLGVTGKDVPSIFADLLEAFSNMYTDEGDVDMSSVAELFRRTKWDSMGLDVIVYWPRIKWVDEEEDEGDD